ncbi:protein YIPF5-like [Argopecten irradians]|uniref:protein YIPF5-like n=1 Tax=Argopecten irradians TaxID=31199 RepID=UPI003710BDE6
MWYWLPEKAVYRKNSSVLTVRTTSGVTTHVVCRESQIERGSNITRSAMSQDFGQEGFYSGNYDTTGQGYDMNSSATQGFGQDPQFGQFDYSQGYTAEQSYSQTPNVYTGSIMTPEVPNAYSGPTGQRGGDNFDDEPPLMEELGINFDHITLKVRLLILINPHTIPYMIFPITV